MEKTPASQPIRVLLVDDDQDDYFLTKELLSEAFGSPMSVEWVHDYVAAVEAACSGSFDIVLLDYNLGARTGLELLQEARGRGCDVPIILLTGLSSPEIDVAAMQSGAVDYLEKSRLDPTLLGRAIRYALQQKQIEADLERRVRERTEELDRANEALRISDRRKDEFIATLAHELRNPLVPIRNALEIMRLGGDAPAVSASSRVIIDRQVGHLIRLIDDLLDVSRLTRNKLQLVTEPLYLHEVIDAAVEQSRPLLDKADQTLTVQPAHGAIRILGDRIRLAQVFTNLLNNSARYSDPGGHVVVAMTRIDDSAMVRVTDTGVGIAPEMLPTLFEPFIQADRLNPRFQGGLGIGLSLVRQLVELHGGTVSARSHGEGKGSEFTVTLPCLPDESPNVVGG